MKAIPAMPANPPLIEPMRRPLLSAGVVKEIRALLPVWLMTLVLPPAILWEWGSGASEQAMGICLIGGVVMAALSMGHEYGHRTLTLLLVQPASRQKLWRQKMAVLAGALSTSTALLILDLWLFVDASKFPTSGDRWSIAALLGAVAVCTHLGTPWVTLLSRHTLGGVVFSFGLPLLLWVGAMLLAELWFRLGGTRPVHEESLVSAFFSASVGLSALAGGILGRRKFLSLETTESPGMTIALPPRLVAVASKIFPRSVTAAGGGLAHLIRKELHLQQVPFYVAGLFAVAWLAQIGIKWLNPQANLDSLDGQGVVCAVLVGLLAGGVSCAEERSGGTLEWHLTLPVPIWKQWLVKSGVVLILTVLLGVILPATVVLVVHGLGMAESVMGLGDFLRMGGIMVSLAAVALHASSASRSAGTAVLLALVSAGYFSLGMWGLADYLAGLTWARVVPVVEDLALVLGLGDWVHSDFFRSAGALAIWAFVLPVFVMLALACTNFRRLSPGHGRYVAQVFGLGLLYGLPSYLYACLQHGP